MNRFKALLKISYLEVRWSFISFWCIVIGIFCVSLYLVTTLAGSENQIHFAPFIAVLIFFFIAGIHTIRQSFSCALGMSATRREYYVSVLLFAVIISALSALLYFVLSVIESRLLQLLALDQFSFFTTFNPLSAPSDLWIYFILPFTILSFSHLLSCILYRFGNKALIVVLGIGILCSAAMSYFDLWALLIYVIPGSIVVITFWLVGISVVNFGLGWLFLRTISVREAA